MREKKYLIIGHGGHGKDEVANLLGLQFQSSSDAALDIFIWDDWGKRNYLNKERCYNDRSNNRQHWYEMICEYNKNDKARLAKEILKTNELYCGMRCEHELAECIKQGIFDAIIWVDACKRLPLEPSNKTKISDARYFIDNNGPLEDLPAAVEHLRDTLIADGIMEKTRFQAAV